MPLVNAKCTNCGGNLQVDNSKEAAICPYCDSAYIVEKAINNYNITNNNTTYINSANINMGADSADSLVEAGMKCLEEKEYDMAWEKYFRVVQKLYPSDYRGVLGELLVRTENWTVVRHFKKWNHARDYVLGTTAEGLIEQVYKELSILAPEKVMGEINVKYEAYIQKIRDEKEKEKEYMQKLRDEEKRKQEKIIQERKEARRAEGKCQYCGGGFSGLFVKKCTKCGTEKDY